MGTATRLVPPLRLGNLLRQARVASGLALADLAATGERSVVELDDIEHGRADLDAASLTELMGLYGIEDNGLVPERSQLVIDLDEGRIAVDHAEVGVGVGVTVGPDAVLARYLALVYRLRDLPVGTPLHLRDVDLGVLSSALLLEADEVERRLRRLIDEESEVVRDQRRIRRQFVMPVAGVIVAATALGTLVLVAELDAPRSPEAVTTVIGTDSVEVGDAAVVEPAPTATDLGPGAGVVEAPPATVVVKTDIGTGGAILENPAGQP